MNYVHPRLRSKVVPRSSSVLRDESCFAFGGKDMRNRGLGHSPDLFSVGGFVMLALCVLAFGWLAPLLEKRGYPSWAFVLRFFGIAGTILCWILAFV